MTTWKHEDMHTSDQIAGRWLIAIYSKLIFLAELARFIPVNIKVWKLFVITIRSV